MVYDNGETFWDSFRIVVREQICNSRIERVRVVLFLPRPVRPRPRVRPVSYTHLTLPTKRIV